MKLSVVIPARNEAEGIAGTIRAICETLRGDRILCEILVVDDGSTDGTAQAVADLAEDYPEVRLVRNAGRHGFGHAVRLGLERFTGDAVAIMMADNSDSPADLVEYYRRLQQGSECVFGSRFMPGGQVVDYPVHKLVINRLANWFIAGIFGIGLTDTTNAFKCYRRHVIEGLGPLISPHFNLTVEMPLKAIVRGFSYDVIPIRWQNRETGVSKLKLKEMGSRYLFIVLYVWMEKCLSRGDYRRAEASPQALREIVPNA